MNTNNIHDRLELYELALIDYEATLKTNLDTPYSCRIERKTCFGFCYYFYKKHNLISVYQNFEKELPELYLMKPKNIELRMTWFYDGEVEPRIECLKKAIELTKQKINKL